MREVDNRGSNFYLALYWAEELAKKDATWQVISEPMFCSSWFSSFHSALQPLAKQLAEAEEQVVKEMVECQVSKSDSNVIMRYAQMPRLHIYLPHVFPPGNSCGRGRVLQTHK